MHIIQRQLAELVHALPQRRRPASVPKDEELLDSYRLAEERTFAAAVAKGTRPEWINFPLTVCEGDAGFAYVTPDKDFYVWMWSSTTGTKSDQIAAVVVARLKSLNYLPPLGSHVGLLCALQHTVLSVKIDSELYGLLTDGTDATIDDYSQLLSYRMKMGITLDVHDVSLKWHSDNTSIPLQTFLTPAVRDSPTLTEETPTQRAARVGKLKHLIEAKGMKFFVHAPYYYNIADSKANHDILIRELRDSVSVGALGVVVHVGHAQAKTMLPKAVFVDREVSNFKHLLEYATSVTPLLLETPPGKANEVTVSPADFVAFWHRLTPSEQAKAGFVVDTCHWWDAGYSPMSGIVYLHQHIPGAIKLIHFNDSNGPCGCRSDIHFSPGGGFTILKQIVAKCEPINQVFAGKYGYIGARRLCEVAKWCEEHNVPCIIEGGQTR